MIRKLIRRWRVSEVTVRLPLIDVSLRPQDDPPFNSPVPPIPETASITAVEVTEETTIIEEVAALPTRLPFAPDSFARLKAAIAAEPYGGNQITLFKTVPEDIQFTVAQVAELVDVMRYSDEKLTVTRLCKDRIVDRENVYLLPSHFSYADDKAAVQKLFRR